MRVIADVTDQTIELSLCLLGDAKEDIADLHQSLM